LNVLVVDDSAIVRGGPGPDGRYWSERKAVWIRVTGGFPYHHRPGQNEKKILEDGSIMEHGKNARAWAA